MRPVYVIFFGLKYWKNQLATQESYTFDSQYTIYTLQSYSKNVLLFHIETRL